jgi:acetyl esterase
MKDLLTFSLILLAALRPLLAQNPPSPQPSPSSTQEETPLTLPGSEARLFRTIGKTSLLLHVVKPSGWTPADRRPCLIAFFAGGWTRGTPKGSLGWAKWAADHGMVGVASDYRTKDRFQGTPEDCVSDGRAAMRWVEDHAGELGIDSSKVVCLGSSAGGHLAAWCAIPGRGPGADDPGSPDHPPAALILFYPVSDTKDCGYGGTKRFDGSVDRALACSVPDRMPRRMPPSLIFHGVEDKTVPCANSIALRDKLVAAGNPCELQTFPGLGHGYLGSKYGPEGAAIVQRNKQDMERFLRNLGLIGAPQPSGSPLGTP